MYSTKLFPKFQQQLDTDEHRRVFDGAATSFYTSFTDQTMNDSSKVKLRLQRNPDLLQK